MSKRNEINIFIVEDNKVFSLALKADIETAFTNMPIQIHSFESGESCMKKFREEKPQVVILDYNLDSINPGAANGIKILERMKRENKATNVIILTSEDSLDIALKSFKHGASDYVVKTETKFRKINYSLFNIFKMMEAKRDAIRYKNLAGGLCLCLALIVGGAIATQIFEPTFFK